MQRKSRLIVAAAVLAVGAMGVSVSTARAADGEPTAQELKEQIQQLQAKVEQLEAKQKQQNDDVAATVQQIVADAERRSTMFAQTTGQNILAGHENGKFILRSEDGNYLLNPSFEMQVRNTTNFNSAGEDNWENGFEIRRAKFRFEGNAVSPDLTYALQWQTAAQGGGVELQDAWVRYKFEPDWYVRGGQFKDPLLHEQLVSGRRQLAADRSLLSLLTDNDSDNYIQGVSLIYDQTDGPWRGEVAFTDGIGDDNTNYHDFPTNNNNFGAAGRVEYFFHGDRKQYDDFTALGNKKELLVVGGGGDVTQSGNQTIFIHTVDVQWENANGLGAYAALIGRSITGDNDAYDWGAQIQGNYLFRPKWEGFARYDFMMFDDDQAVAPFGAEDFFHELTVGVNYYVQSHAAKFTLDLTYLPNGCPNNQNGLGIQPGDDDQLVFRGQFQLLL
jgi:outer membrane murein-binding lipoprotein Lpp